MRSCQNFSHVFLGGGSGEKGATKLSQNLPKVSLKVSPKFWQNFMSSKFKKKHTTLGDTDYQLQEQIE